jgi:subtilisin-like proprotein convertase family protein
MPRKLIARLFRRPTLLADERLGLVATESMEPRRMLAGISGGLFDDVNGDGLEGTAEAGRVSVGVYVDDNNNGLFDQSSWDFRPAELPRSIPDPGVIRSEAVATGVTGPLRRIYVVMNVAHDHDGDLTATLVSPAGTRVQLFSHIPGYPNALNYVEIADDGATPVGLESPDGDRVHRPTTPLSVLMDENPNGMWTLELGDDAAGASGTLSDWYVGFQSGEQYTRTDANGRYAFGGLPAGSHTVRLIENEFQSQTFPALEQGQSVTVGEGDTVTVADFGARRFQPGYVGGHVYVDANGNGRLDVGESGMAGQTIYIDWNNNGVFDDEVRVNFASADVPKPLADAQTEDDERSITTSTLDVHDLPAELFGMTVTLDLDHTRTSDLIVTLISPLGTRYELSHYETPGSTTGFHGTRFDASAWASQEPKNGTWSLEVLDSQLGNTGTLNAWSVSFVTRAAESHTVTGGDGSYELGEFGGPVTVRQVVPEGYAQTSPGGGGAYQVQLAEEEMPGRTRQFGVMLVPNPATVVGRNIFYNHSNYDDNDAAATAADDLALATDKRALLAAEDRLPAFDNVTSYSKGINGVMIDVAGLPQGEALNADDFDFGGAGAPTSVTVRRGAGAAGSDRVTLIWRDYNPLDASSLPQAVANGWLAVTVKANAHTGLAGPDLFSFGNLIGETGDGGGATGWRVSALDVAAVKRRLSAATTVTSVTDFNRDGRTNALDVAIVKRALGQTLALFLRSPVAAMPPETRQAEDILV